MISSVSVEEAQPADEHEISEESVSLDPPPSVEALSELAPEVRLPKPAEKLLDYENGKKSTQMSQDFLN